MVVTLMRKKDYTDDTETSVDDITGSSFSEPFSLEEDEENTEVEEV